MSTLEETRYIAARVMQGAGIYNIFRVHRGGTEGDVFQAENIPRNLRLPTLLSRCTCTLSRRFGEGVRERRPVRVYTLS